METLLEKTITGLETFTEEDKTKLIDYCNDMGYSIEFMSDYQAYIKDILKSHNQIIWREGVIIKEKHHITEIGSDADPNSEDVYHYTDTRLMFVNSKLNRKEVIQDNMNWYLILKRKFPSLTDEKIRTFWRKIFGIPSMMIFDSK